jgi:site-specific DNA-methyltransferase (adenine-specific)
MGMNVHFSSVRMDWQTPDDTFKALDDEFHFMFDPAMPNYKELNFDGLTDNWGSCNFVNPPYGRELPKWIAKGYSEYQRGKTVVFLIPSRTDTRWWHDYCMKADEIRFIKGRLKFKGAKNSAPFPSAIVIFKANPTTESEQVR